MRRELFITLISLSIIGFSNACSNVYTDDIVIDDIPIVDDNENFPDFKEWFDYLCSEELGGRYSGSDGIKKAVTYLSNIIRQSDSLEIDTFDTPRCEMKNIIFHIKGESDSLIVLGAHYDAHGYVNDTPYPGADDNLSGTAVMLSLIKGIQKKKIQPKYSIDICLFDGEEIGRFGSRRYLSVCRYGIKRYINVDTCGNKDCGIFVLYSNIHPFLKSEFEGLVKDIKMELSEYDPQGFTTDCEPFAINQIPFVCIDNEILLPDYLHRKNDDVSHISFRKLSIISKGLDTYLRNL